MPPLKLNQVPEPDRDQKMEMRREKWGVTMTCGAVLMAAYKVLDSLKLKDQGLDSNLEEDIKNLKEILIPFCSINAQDLVEYHPIGKPFKDIDPNNVYREVDPLWEQTMVDDSLEFIDGDCPCKIGFFNGQINIRWTLPRPIIIGLCNNPKKLVYTAMVIAEELFHLTQLITPNTRSIMVLSSLLELGKLKDAADMDWDDQELFIKVFENDVTFFVETYFASYSEQIQWFKDRLTASGDHKQMTPQEFIEAVIYFANKYGYPEDIAETLTEDIFYCLRKNPQVGSQMLLAKGLSDFVGKNKILENILKLLQEDPALGTQMVQELIKNESSES